MRNRKRDVDIIFTEYKKIKKDSLEKETLLHGIKKAKIIYPFAKLLLWILTVINGEKVTWLKKENINIQTNQTVVYVNTHRFKPDFEKITLKTKSPSFVIASDFKNSYKTISGWYFNTMKCMYYEMDGKLYSMEN